MSIALLSDAEVGQLPQAEPLTPRSMERVTAPAEALGLESESATVPSYVMRARSFAADNPSSVVAWARLAQAEQTVGNSEAAIEAATMAVRLSDGDSLHSSASLSAAALLARLQPEMSEAVFAKFDHPLARLNAAAAAIERGDHQSVIESLKGMDAPSARALRAFAYIHQDDPQRAVAEYRAARKSGYDSLDILINLGFAFSRLGSTAKAIRVTQEATRRAPANKTASYNLARYFVQARKRELAAKELDRLASARPWDHQVLLHQAWSHAYSREGMRRAIRILSSAQTKFRSSTEPIIRAEIASSIAYLRWQLGLASPDSVRKVLWRELRSAEFQSVDVVRMLLTLLDRRDHLAELRLILDEAGDVLEVTDRHLAESKLLLLSGHLEAATQRAIEATEADPTVRTNAAATAAYLLGEVRGDYERGARLASVAFTISPDVGMANNYAFCLALSGRGREALQILSEFDRSELPYHGATRGLALLAIGRVDEGITAYREAEALVRLDGDETTADYIAVRCDLARRQLGIQASEASDGSGEMHWPSDRGEGRWLVLCRVAERVGVQIPPIEGLA